jgi:BirA family transcriptional regulator, biotin operon repressor / biotin---[acetyl-CoA-carboxylase] ligase
MGDGIDQGSGRQRTLLSQLADGRFHSGEQLARLLGISRTLVWREVELLREAFALDIHAVRGRGYRLAQPIELLQERRILEALPAHQGELLRQLQLLLSVDSTSNHLLKQLPRGIDSGSICCSEHQTAGRGRRGRSWISPFGGSIYLSLYWRFDRGMTEVGGLSLAAGAVVAAVLSKYLHGVALKWPNDVIVAGGKIAGILVDVQGSAEGPVDIIIGLGVNLRLPESASRHIDQPWTDIHQHHAGHVSRNRLTADLIGELLQAMQLFQEQQLLPFAANWRRYDAFHGRDVELLHGSGKVRGIHKGIADDGSLLLEVNGRIEQFHSGEVSLRGADTP